MSAQDKETVSFPDGSAVVVTRFPFGRVSMETRPPSSSDAAVANGSQIQEVTLPNDYDAILFMAEIEFRLRRDASRQRRGRPTTDETAQAYVDRLRMESLL